MSARLAVDQELGDYRIAEFLGGGGMGDVYRAVHRTLGRECALKVTGSAVGAEARFENEARIQASLSHPNIAAMLAYFEDGGRRCLVMEFVPGETLASRIARERRIAPAAALRLLEDVARGAAFMHARGIVHRDLTPSNIRITPDGRVKLLDFGIAKIEHRKGLTAEGHVIGTPAYLAPEQLRAGGATPQSDVWALGVLLFEMIEGRPPFAGRFPSDVWRAIEAGRTPALDDAAADPARRRANAVLERCLAIDPARRFAHAGELVAALGGRTHATHRAHVHLSHVLAHPRTRQAAAGALIAIALVAAGAFAVSRDDRVQTPTSVHRIDVSQGVAEVRINGKRRGRTPYDYHAAPNETVSLELRQPGFLPATERFVVTERPVWTFAMRREP